MDTIVRNFDFDQAAVLLKDAMQTKNTTQGTMA
jgi:hypothetical protein